MSEVMALVARIEATKVRKITLAPKSGTQSKQGS